MTAKSFDERAATWDDDPVKVERAELAANMIRAMVSLDGSERFLDYGAGTGLLSEALRDDLGSIVLAEVSAGMRDVIRGKQELGTLPADAGVWDLDLTVGELPDDRFDLIAIVMTLHHVVEAVRLLDVFARMLRPGGHLCIVDLDSEDGTLHGVEFEGHRGFDRVVLERQLREVGFEQVEFRPLLELERPTGRYPVFFAVARNARQG